MIRYAFQFKHLIHFSFIYVAQNPNSKSPEGALY